MFRSLFAAVILVATLGMTASLADPLDGPDEAPASFEMVSNGVSSQEDFLDALGDFIQDAVESGDDEAGLGPTYNATSCVACHRNPAIGGESQIFELRVGHFDGITFTTPKGGSLVRQRAINPAIQQRVPEGFEVRTRRRSTSLFGLVYVENVPDSTLLAIRDAQPPDVRGLAVSVPVTTAISKAGVLTQLRRIGRFGWKCQHGSLLDFSADAEVNEKGVTSPIQPFEMPALDGRSLSAFDKVADPEDQPTDARPFGHDVTAYTKFMRSLQAPPTDFTLSATDDAKAGAALFSGVGCAVCHVPTLVTAPPGAQLTGIQDVPEAVGNKSFHPYSDFLLHDIGTGDGIVMNGPPESRNKLRTAPLWGLRCRPELLHDGSALTIDEAIRRHGNQGAKARDAYLALPDAQQKQVRVFLLSR